MLKYQNVSGHQCIGTQVHKYTVNGCTNCSKLLMCSVVIFFKKYTQNILYLSNIFTDLKSKTFDWIPMEEREMYILRRLVFCHPLEVIFWHIYLIYNHMQRKEVPFPGFSRDPELSLAETTPILSF